MTDDQHHIYRSLGCLLCTTPKKTHIVQSILILNTVIMAVLNTGWVLSATRSQDKDCVTLPTVFARRITLLNSCSSGETISRSPAAL